MIEFTENRTEVRNTNVQGDFVTVLKDSLDVGATLTIKLAKSGKVLHTFTDSSPTKNTVFIDERQTELVLENQVTFPFDVSFNRDKDVQATSVAAPRKGGVVVNSATNLSIYLPTDAGYVEYIYEYVVDLSKEVDTWQLNQAYVCDTKKNRTLDFSITKENSRWEFAVKTSGAGDYVGGTAHGWEKYSAIKFTLDGKEWTPADGNADFTRMSIHLKGDIFMHNSAAVDPDDKLAEYSIGYIFDNSGLTLDVFFDWVRTATLAPSYVAMVPCIRDDGAGTQVTSMGVTDNEQSAQDISSYPHSATLHRHARYAKAFGGDLGLSFEVRQIHISDKTYQDKTFFSNTDTSNKIYTEVMDGESVLNSINSISSYTYRIKINQK